MRTPLVVVGMLLAFLVGGDGVEAQRAPRCHPSYRRACVPISDGDLDCEVVWRRGICDLPVVGPDDYGFDGDSNGMACECVSMRMWRERQRHRR